MLVALPAFGGSFEIVPLSLVLSAETRISTFEVTNNGEEKVAVQGEAVEWSQDENGVDIYVPAKDIAFFPRIFSLEKDEKKALRVGYQGEPSRTVEKTYRLILREIPAPRSGPNVIRMALRLSVPIFVTPAKETLDSSVEKAWITEGTLRFKVTNRGNVHAIAKRIKATGFGPSGATVFSKEFKGWYVLAGHSATFLTEITEEECRASKTVKVLLTTDRATRDSTLALDASDCARRAPNGK